MRKLIRWILRGSAGLLILGFIGLLAKAVALRTSYQMTADSIQGSAYGFGQMLVLTPIAVIIMTAVGILWYVSRKV